MRAEGSRPLERVARLRAPSDTVMAWADTSAPGGVPLRYAIRRECRDVRYQTTSAEARWEPRGAMLVVAVKSRNPASATIELEVVGANQGPIQIHVYDIQGREITRRSILASGAGRDEASLSLDGTIRQGLYLLRVRSADGRLSPTAKVAVLR